MAAAPTRPRRLLLSVALLVELFLLGVAAATFFFVSRYVEFNLRWSVEHTALQVADQWRKNLKTLAREPSWEPTNADAAHLLPLLGFRARLTAGVEPAKHFQAVPPIAEGIWVHWPGDFAQGLEGQATLKAETGCRRCHGAFTPGQVVGSLAFRVETTFLTKLLVSRRLNLLMLVGTVFLSLSAGLWVLVAMAWKRQREAEEAKSQAEERLAASERLYRTLVEHNLAGVYLISGDRFLYCNPRFAEITGYSQEELITRKRVSELVAPEDRALVAENLRKRLTGEIQSLRYCFHGLRSDGTRVPAEVLGTRVDLPSGPAVLGTLLDNTEQEMARQTVEAAYRAVVALPGEDVFQAACSSLGELLNVPVVFVSEASEESLLLLGAHGAVQREPIPVAGTPCEIAMREKHAYAVPSGFVSRFGQPGFVQLVPESYFGVPLLTEAGSVLGVLAVIDTEPRNFSAIERQILEIYAVRLARELERRKLLRQQKELETRLLAQEKLAALGVLAGGIAHDFNNVLAGIMAEAEALKHSLASGTHPRLDRVINLAERGGEVVRRILAFARPVVAKPEPLSLSRVVNDTVELAQHTLGPQFHFQVLVDPDLFVLAEEAALEQVLLNLFTNARDAMPEGGPIVIQTVARGDVVDVVVEDQGTGIDPAHLPRVFDPFFTTKPQGRGSGLGLTMVYRTVEAFGGTVRVESQVGVGTRVVVTLPRAHPPAAPVTSQETQPVRSKTGSRVLLVDDEPSVRQALQELLELQGYRVIGASSAEEALERFDPNEVHVAVVDVLLPGMNGVELAQRLWQKKQDLAVVFSTGHAPETLGAEICGRESVCFLQKPYTFRQLLECLEKLGF